MVSLTVRASFNSHHSFFFFATAEKHVVETEPPPTVHPRGQPISGSERNISLPWNRGRFDGAFRTQSVRNLWRRPRRDPREWIPPPGGDPRGPRGEILVRELM